MLHKFRIFQSKSPRRIFAPGKMTRLLLFALISGWMPIHVAMAVPGDADNDGIPDNVDIDDDNDGILDSVEGASSVSTAVDSGVDGALADANVTFGITSAAPTVESTPHVLDSITISGVNALMDATYTDLILPDNYVSNFSITVANRARGVENGAVYTEYTSDPLFDSSVLSAFQDFNLQHFQLLDSHNFSGDSFSLFYDTPVTSNAGGFVAFTERGGNNPAQLAAFDASGTLLGSVDVTLATYIDTGYVANNYQTISIAVFPIDDIAPAGSQISEIRVLMAGNTSDGPDGKVFLYGDASKLIMLTDTDNDGIPDKFDLDSDNDGITDLVESGDVMAIASDANGDGMLGSSESSDYDNDGLMDEFEDGNLTTDAGTTPQDSDADMLADYRDLDSDNDGITDTTEAGGTDADGNGLVDVFNDTNDDGMDDAINATPLPVDDFDNDGQPDYLDLDSDNDGLTDTSEAGGLDSNGDGQIDGFTDANTDGLDDDTLATPLPVDDTDADSSPDYLDLDSDGDGLNDIVEAGGTDTNDDGLVDAFADADGNGLDDAIAAAPLPDDDFDGDGMPDHTDVDSDNDGIPDAVEAANGAVDSDGDGQADHLDLDSDNDGIPDAVEGPGENADADADGIDDYYDVDVTGGVDANNDGVDDASVAEDFDGDGNPDYLDLDSDNDGLTDASEAGAIDANGDGVVDTFVDVDSDGLDDALFAAPLNPDDTDADTQPDYLDLDSDNDGIPDITEAGGTDTDSDGSIDNFTDANDDGLDDPTAALPLFADDFDGDGISDHHDLDSDNDGIPDVIEAGGVDANGDGIIDGFTDADGDGFDDATGLAPLPVEDTDDDNQPDYLDLDSDNDGIPDVTEAGGADVDNDGEVDNFTDANSDGLDDTTATSPLPTDDSDSDGIADYLDLDSDNDGLPDVTEAGGADSNGNGIIDGFTDADNNGLDDATTVSSLPVDDTDSDSIPDHLDLDSDNDGIPDVTEAGGSDTDSDGIVDSFTDADNDGLDDATAASPLPVDDTDGDNNPDYLDLDSDNDGITDTNEAGGTDADGDGIIDGFSDADGDGLDNATASTPLPIIDTDNDGDPDHLDLDADDDGLDDIFESGGSDADGDGMVDNFTDANGDGLDDTVSTPVNDFDGDGILDHEDLDSDNDGIPDAEEAASGPVDSDLDGQPDHLDLDSDNDGIPDVLEAGGTDADGNGVIDGFADLDGDGMDDATEVVALPLTDSDGDGNPDHLDLDSDNDGIPDVTEAGGADVDSDGVVDNFTDTDGDGLDDVVATMPLPADDTDGDSIPDYLDLDSDNDGIPDVTEAGGADVDSDGVVDNFTDTDGDGLDDATGVSALPIDDTDSDGEPDYLDIDSDNDGITDTTEAGGSDLDGDGAIDDFTDADGDGLDDAVVTLPLPIDDSDADGIPDYQELDSDADGIPDMIEAGVTPNQPADTDGDGVNDYQELDSDNDGIPDSIEAGLNPTNPADTDGDGTPDYMELDSDNDGLPDNTEAGVDPTNPVDTDGDGVPDFLESETVTTEGPVASTDTDVDGIPDDVEGTGDTDGDGIPDFLDLDSDNDGLLDSDEAAGSLGSQDTDADGIPDHLDLDSDNDGLTDTFEARGSDLDGDGIVDNFTDADGNGWDDGVSVSPLPDPDFDGDGIVDHLDLDSDNDGLADLSESNSASIDANGDGMIDSPVDANGDGLADGIVINAAIDADGDGAADHLDLDSDNDGVFDLVEAGGADENEDGIVDSWSDHDSDGIPDNIDFDLVGGSDSDADGIADFADADFVALTDSDGDGVVDEFDVNPLGDGFIPAVNSTGDTQAEGLIHSGLAGSGCVVGGQSSGIDPLLAMMAMLSLILLRIRQCRRQWRVGLLFAGLVLAVSGCSSTAELEPEEDRFSRSIYGGIGIGSSRLEPDTSELEEWDVNDRDDTGGQLTLGVDLSRQLSLELHAADLGSAGFTPRGRLNYKEAGVSALLYAGKNRHRYRRQGLTGYGRIGYGVLDNSPVGDVPYVQDNSTHFLFGLGLEYMTRIGLGVRAEVIAYEEDAQYTQLGLIYRTGKRRERTEEIVAAPEPVPVPVPEEKVVEEPVVVEEVVATDICQGLQGNLAVTFQTNSAELTSQSTDYLKEVSETLKRCDNRQIRITAHTDSVGDEAYNMALSKRRAKSVVIYLVRQGVELRRFSAAGYGETKPVDTNETKEGRSRNRRVELELR